MVEQLFRLEDIINALVTTDYMESEDYKTRIGKFKNWVEYWQNYFLEYYWESPDKSIEELKEGIDNLYYDLVRASSDKYTDKMERELSPQAEVIEKKKEDDRTSEDKRILDELWLCRVKREYNPVIKRDEDREFLANWVKEHNLRQA